MVYMTPLRKLNESIKKYLLMTVTHLNRTIRHTKKIGSGLYN